MPHTPKPINKQRDEATYIANTSIDLIIHNHSAIMHRSIDIEALKPYFVHDVKANITYIFGKTEITSKDLCEVLKVELKQPEKAQFFQDATCIEFYKECEQDLAPRVRFIKVQQKIREAIKNYNLPIIFSIAGNFASSKTESDNHPYTEYIVLKPDTSKGYTHIEISRKQ